MGVFRILFWNANGLRPKLDELRNFVVENPVDLILIQEVRCKFAQNFKISNFKTYFTPRVDDNVISPYGGTAIFVSSRVDHALLPSLPLDLMENTNVKIYLDSQNSFVVSSIYLRVSNSYLALPNDLNQLFQLDDSVILAGDFNSHHPTWCASGVTDNLGISLYQYCLSNGIEIAAPSSPTRFDPRGTSTTIDLALLDNIPYPYTITPFSALTSDHLPVQISLDRTPTLPSLSSNFSIDWNIFTSLIHNSPPPFGVFNSIEDIETTVHSLNKLVKNSLDSSKFHHAPQNFHDLPREIKIKIKERNRLRRLWQNTRDPGIRSDMNRLSANIKRSVKNFKNSKWSDFISSLTPSDNSVWNYLKRVRKPFTPIPPIKTDAGIHCSDTDKVEVIADHYEKQFHPHSDIFNPQTIDHVDHVIEKFLARRAVRPIDPTTPEEVISVIQNLPNRKAPGIDGISNSAIKNLPINYAYYLADLINAIFHFRHFPPAWKHAIVVPIKKPGEDPALAKSYRPVSLLPVLSKLTEHIFMTRLHQFYTDTPEQFGFRPKHSTAHQLLRVVEFIHDGLDNSEVVGGLFIDVAKAFDTVWHSGLIYKLLKLKFPTAYVQFIFSYLRDRSFSVRYSNKHSTPRPINAGVPQGSKLGPLLFKIFINDIPRHPNTMLALYADDTGVLARASNREQLHTHLQSHIHILENYFNKWRIKINPSKSVAVFFSKKRLPPPPLNLNGSFVHFGREVKYLGVYLDSNLTWRKHIDYSVRKFYKAKTDLAHLLYNDKMSMGNKLLLFKTVLSPILLYCSSVWGSAANCHINKLQIIQNKILRGVCRAPWYRRNITVHADTKIDPIRKTIKKRALNFFNNIYSIPNPELFNIPDYDERENYRRPRSILHIPEVIKP